MAQNAGEAGPEQNGVRNRKLNADQPLVSVVILYYKRRETIEESVNSVLTQDYPNIELIVVDNHSEDDVQAVIEQRGARVKLIQLAENIGACGGRNAGLRASHGEIVVFLEDDVKLLSSFEISKMMNMFDTHPNIHVLAFQVCDPDTGKLRLREWCHPRNWKEHSESEFETTWFGEGASAFRREALDACGGYYEPLFYGAEGDDLVVRLFNHGFHILHAPQVRVGHRASETGRSSYRQYYYFTRNYFWMAYKDFPFFAGIRYLIPKIGMMGLFALRSGAFKTFLRGAWDGIAGLKKIRADRTPANRLALEYLRQLEKWRPNVFVRLSRHREAPQI
ncbi:MAG: glycosyltransferase family 2 protein [Candidatus Acidiferrales bacterium]